MMAKCIARCVQWRSFHMIESGCGLKLIFSSFLLSSLGVICLLREQPTSFKTGLNCHKGIILVALTIRVNLEYWQSLPFS